MRSLAIQGLGLTRRSPSQLRRCWGPPACAIVEIGYDARTDWLAIPRAIAAGNLRHGAYTCCARSTCHAGGSAQSLRRRRSASAARPRSIGRLKHAMPHSDLTVSERKSLCCGVPSKQNVAGSSPAGVASFFVFSVIMPETISSDFISVGRKLRVLFQQSF